MDRRTFLKSAGVASAALSSVPTTVPPDLEVLIAQHRQADLRWNDMAGTGAVDEAFWERRECELRAALLRRPATPPEFGAVLSYLTQETWRSWTDGEAWLRGELLTLADSMMGVAA